MAVIHSSNGTLFILTGQLAVIHCLSNSFSSGMFLSKKSWFQVIISMEYPLSSIQQSTVLYIFQQLHLNQLLFDGNICFRTPSCLDQLLLSNNYFLVTNAFCGQLLLDDKYFFRLRRSWFLEKGNYSEHVIFWSRYFFRTATFSGELF